MEGLNSFFGAVGQAYTALAGIAYIAIQIKSEAVDKKISNHKRVLISCYLPIKRGWDANVHREAEVNLEDAKTSVDDVILEAKTIKPGTSCAIQRANIERWLPRIKKSVEDYKAFRLLGRWTVYNLLIFGLLSLILMPFVPSKEIMVSQIPCMTRLLSSIYFLWGLSVLICLLMLVEDSLNLKFSKVESGGEINQTQNQPNASEES